MKDIETLLVLWMEGGLSPEDREDLDRWLAASPEHAVFFAALGDREGLVADLQKMDGYDGRAIWAKVARMRGGPVSAEMGKGRVRRMFWRRVAAAAVLIGLVGSLWLVRRPGDSRGLNSVASSAVADVAAPARSRATITLAGGKMVVLDSVANGQLAEQGGAEIVKGVSGQVSYRMEAGLRRELLYNTLTNPRGSAPVTLSLSDGTKVWLNAESSIRYPAVFLESERSVEMSGEAYFEVTSDAGKPFRVMHDSLAVDVLGTSFNINAYRDEPELRVTLITGKVAVAEGEKRLVLVPGQQAELAGGRLRLAAAVDLEAVMAWKNGLFAFRDANLAVVMRQLARWYDIDVAFAGAVPPGTFDGKIGKSLTLDQLLRVLTRTRVHYRIEGKKLTILP